MVTGDQEHDRLAAVLVVDVKVAQRTEVAEGDSAAGIESLPRRAPKSIFASLLRTVTSGAATTFDGDRPQQQREPVSPMPYISFHCPDDILFHAT